MNDTQLPDKPSDLIRLALDDLKKCEADPDYAIDMNDWHEGGDVCLVCFAGAVMAKSLGANRYDDTAPLHFRANDDKLRALDYFRQGDVYCGLESMGLDVYDDPHDVEIPAYREGPDEFHKAMRELADTLEQAGP